MGLRKRVSALLLAVLLSFGVCAVDYLKVEAIEVGGGIVSWETASNFLFGLLGIAPSEKTMEEYVNWDEWRDAMATSSTQYFLDHLSEADLPEGKTKDEAIQDWIFSVCNGNLDKLSPCWDLYKEWAESQVVQGNASSSVVSVSSHAALQSAGFTSATLQTAFETIPDFQVTCGMYKYDGGYINCTLYGTPSYFELSGNSYALLPNNSTIVTCYLNARYDTIYSCTYNPNFYITSSGSIPARNTYIFGSVNGVRDNASYKDFVWDLSGSISPSVPAFDSVVPVENITNLEVINDYSTTTSQNVVSIDWDKIGAMISDAVGTVTGSLDRTITDALDDAQEKVAAGTMSVSNYNDYVTEISNTYVYDITNETSITNPDSTVSGVVSGNAEKTEFTLAGLQYVFPFCIPWDIRDFVTLLVADPVAPVIEYPIYNPVTDTDEIITIDFSLWENQVRIIRYIFDFLLIIGLLLLARSLIGAGGSD